GPVKELGSVSPAFLPYHVLKVAGSTHPYYTGFLGDLRQQFSVVDRHMLLKADGNAVADWLRQKEVEPLLKNFRYLQYDMMFGKKFGASDFFPETAAESAHKSCVGCPVRQGSALNGRTGCMLRAGRVRGKPQTWPV